jgi:ankyrin repeat protein
MDNPFFVHFFKDKKALLHIACESGYLEMVQLLIRGGADIHARDKVKLK